MARFQFLETWEPPHEDAPPISAAQENLVRCSETDQSAMQNAGEECLHFESRTMSHPSPFVTTAPSRINPAQKRHIESVHRGFLFQHLYAVGCLLSAEPAEVTAVIVEGDEDIEVVHREHRDYIQVKTRSSSLNYCDIEGALHRFNILRAEHASGSREGGAKFFFVANQPPGPGLLGQLVSNEWPKDVYVLWPSQDSPEIHRGLPPAWLDISEAFHWCVARAQEIPFRRLMSDTMVWKLAAQAMLAASGGEPYQNHTFMTADLPALFEQLVISLQDFPQLPGRYRPQSNEPNLVSEQRVRIIAGFSGAGKTTWASEVALHSGEICVYFDVGETPGPALPLLVAQEVAAKLAASSAETPIRDILLPNASGTESLRLVDCYTERKGFHLVVVIDNAHRVTVDILRATLEVTKHLRFVLLCQPTGSIQELEAMLGVRRESLEGWDDDTVAAAVAELGAIGSPNSIQRLRSITSGMPLYVESAGRVAVSDYGGDIEKLCAAIDSQTHTTETAQEIILSKVCEALPGKNREVVAILGFCEVGLLQAELISLLKDALQFSAQDVALLIRALRPMGILQTLSGDQFKLHDAFRVLGKRHFDSMEQDKKMLVWRGLVRILLGSLRESRDTKRLSMLIRATTALGDHNFLVGFAGEEMFHELGIDSDIWQSLEDAAISKDLNPKQRFAALDGLVFRSFKIGNMEKVPERLAMMEKLLTTGALDDHDKMVFMTKRMQWQSSEGDFEAVMASLAAINEIIPDAPEYQRILRYNTAQALWQLRRVKAAECILRDLVQDYYQALGISSDQVLGRSVDSIKNAINRTGSYQADIKHLADTLEFHAKTIAHPKQKQIITRLQSMKFYEMVDAHDSLVRVGMDLVDDHLTVGDTFGAKDFMEKFVMPAAERLDFALARVFVHSQYAVVLARCGEHREAEVALGRLRPYYGGTTEEERRGLMLNERLVREASLQKSHFHWAPPKTSVGRNDSCPCGSGIKFKKCHGR